MSTIIVKCKFKRKTAVKTAVFSMRLFYFISLYLPKRQRKDLKDLWFTPSRASISFAEEENLEFMKCVRT